MKKHVILTALSLVVCIPTILQAQQAQGVSAPPDRVTVIKAAKEVMTKARYCALITIGDDGQPQARVVDPFFPEDDMTVWLATSPATRKVAQIVKDPRVTLFYFDTGTQGYVTVLGKAELIRDPAEKAKQWKEEWASFYKDKNRGDDYMLIRVKPRRLEIVSYAHGLANDPQTWRPVMLELP